jgi:hypothetical protein
MGVGGYEESGGVSKCIGLDVLEIWTTADQDFERGREWCNSSKIKEFLKNPIFFILSLLLSQS